MLQQKIEIINKLGLHARAATQLVKMAEPYDADITLSLDDMEADAKSIMDVLMLAATKGSTVVLTVSGDDSEEEQAVVDKITELFKVRFHEKE